MPSIGSPVPTFPSSRKLAAGRILTARGFFLGGERGREAVLPLEGAAGRRVLYEIGGAGGGLVVGTITIQNWRTDRAYFGGIVRQEQAEEDRFRQSNERRRLNSA